MIGSVFSCRPRQPQPAKLMTSSSSVPSSQTPLNNNMHSVIVELPIFLLNYYFTSLGREAFPAPYLKARQTHPTSPENTFYFPFLAIIIPSLPF